MGRRKRSQAQDAQVLALSAARKVPQFRKENSPPLSLPSRPHYSCLASAQDKARKLHNISRQLTRAKKKNLALTTARNIAQKAVKQADKAASGFQLQLEQTLSHAQETSTTLADASNCVKKAEHDLHSTQLCLSTVQARNQVLNPLHLSSGV